LQVQREHRIYCNPPACHSVFYNTPTSLHTVATTSYKQQATNLHTAVHMLLKFFLTTSIVATVCYCCSISLTTMYCAKWLHLPQHTLHSQTPRKSPTLQNQSALFHLYLGYMFITAYFSTCSIIEYVT